MGKTKPQKVIEKCDEWLSTRNKRKVSPSLNLIKKHPLSSGSLKSSSSLRLTQNSPPPPELFTNTKQSNITVFFTKTRPQPDNSKDKFETQNSDEDDNSNDHIMLDDDDSDEDHQHVLDCKGDYSSNKHGVTSQNTYSVITEDSSDVTNIISQEHYLSDDDSPSHQRVPFDTQNKRHMNKHQYTDLSSCVCSNVCICDDSYDTISPQDKIIEPDERHRFHSETKNCNFSKDADQRIVQSDSDILKDDSNGHEAYSDYSTKLHPPDTQESCGHSLKNPFSSSCNSDNANSFQFSLGHSSSPMSTKHLLNSEEADEDLQDFSLSMHL